MATRYVWGKYNKATQKARSSSTNSIEIRVYNDSYLYTCPVNDTLPTEWASTQWNKTAFFGGTGASAVVPANTCFEITFSPVDSGEKITFDKATKTNGSYTLKATNEGNYYDEVIIPSGKIDDLSIATVKGTFVATVSNSSSGAYPQNGVSGNYWYTYQGSDTKTRHLTKNRVSYARKVYLPRVAHSVY